MRPPLHADSAASVQEAPVPSVAAEAAKAAKAQLLQRQGSKQRSLACSKRRLHCKRQRRCKR